MRNFLIAGFLYLLGIALVLVWKPEFMFTREGIWKEFGIGRNPATHTWMPFWLFTILWALLSYMLTLVLSPLTPMKIMRNVSEIPEEMGPKIQKGKLPRGYYILNTNDSQAGIPSYIYLGKNLEQFE